VVDADSRRPGGGSWPPPDAFDYAAAAENPADDRDLVAA
jgi:hypothetical protein